MDTVALYSSGVFKYVQVAYSTGTQEPSADQSQVAGIPSSNPISTCVTNAELDLFCKKSLTLSLVCYFPLKLLGKPLCQLVFVYTGFCAI